MAKATKSDPNRDAVIEWVFRKNYVEGAAEVPFTIGDIREAIKDVSAKNPAYVESNVPDLRYQYTSGRSRLPQAIERSGPWMIVGKGKGRYAFFKITSSLEIKVPEDLEVIYLPDATPEIVLEYAGSDEQGILAKLNYNRILDIFLQLTCYHLQNHWRTSVRSKGQCEIDDMYVGLNNVGKQFIVPVEAKSWKDKLHKTQVVQMIDLARERYPKLLLRPVGVQELRDNSIVLAEFTPANHPDEVKVKEFRRYKLVPMDQVPFDTQQSAP